MQLLDTFVYEHKGKYLAKSGDKPWMPSPRDFGAFGCLTSNWLHKDGYSRKKTFKFNNKLKMTAKLENAAKSNVWQRDNGEIIGGKHNLEWYRKTYGVDFQLVNVNDIHQVKPKRKARKAPAAVPGLSSGLLNDIRVAALCAQDHLRAGNTDRVNDFLQSIIDITRG